MFDIKTDVAQLQDEVRRLEQAYTIVDATLPVLAMQAGQDVVDYAQYLFRQPKHGNPRQKKDGSGMMIGSAPGEAPAIDTGTLDTGFLAQVRGYMVTVDPKQPYAAKLELDMNRPFMGPAAQFAGDRFVRSIIHMIEKAY